MRNLGTLLLCIIVFISGQASCQSGTGNYRIAFYNVENLFDTISHTIKDDKEFTPQSKAQWNTERYTKKLRDLSRVIEDMDSPFIVGLSEVENGDVLTDLCQVLQNKYYQHIHHHSPDNRGIDVALLYQPEYFRPIMDRPIPVYINIETEVVGTRDILHVAGIFQPTGDTLDIFVNHWPSRRGGMQQSEHRRLAAADTLKNAVEKLWLVRPNAIVIITGDFNDDPDNASMQKSLLTAQHSLNSKRLVNISLDKFKSGLGTYNYQGNWNMLDQFVISDCLTNRSGRIKFERFQIFKPDYLIFQHPRFGDMPSRTYGGPNYYGGTSDHFPVIMEFSRN